MTFFLSLSAQNGNAINAVSTVSPYFNGELSLGVMATYTSDLGSQMGILKTQKVKWSCASWFLEGSCAMASQDAVSISVPFSLPLLLGFHLLGV